MDNTVYGTCCHNPLLNVRDTVTPSSESICYAIITNLRPSKKIFKRPNEFLNHVFPETSFVVLWRNKKSWLTDEHT
jgi:hypothetical protein